MKTKLNLLLTAVMLLLSANVFAQSGSTNPAKGDVNGDGTVDVADIVAVIDIMKNGGGTATVGYFYLGTTAPTAENYKTLPGAVTTFASFDAAVGSTASVAAGQTLYLLCPAAWMKGKTPALEDKDGNTISFLEEKDEVKISDYVIYKTQVMDASSTVTLKKETVYYWYVGQTQPTSLTSDPTVDDENFTNNKWHTLGTATTINQSVKNGTAGNEWFVATPKDKYVPTASDLSTVDSSQIVIETITIGTEQYDVWSTGVETKLINVWMKKK